MQDEKVMHILVLKLGADLGIAVAYGAHRKLRWMLGLSFCRKTVYCHRKVLGPP
ncbi:hypothetical protein HanIR_Chr02g0058621 [Helianthus annuus]|nr:hypothetical protein HanIR_Chr02g0058621 [Helianthus annuus]